MASPREHKELKAQWKSEVEVRTISIAEVAKHNSKNDNWIVIHGKVYNVTNYARDHPGGAEALIEVAGTDATSAYEDVGHSEDAGEIMHSFLVGVIEASHGSKAQGPLTVKLVPHEDVDKRPTKSGSLTMSQVETAGSAICFAVLVWFIRTTHWLPHPSSLHLPESGFAVGFLCASGVGAAFGFLGYAQWNKMMAFGGNYTRFPAHMPVSSHAVSRSRTMAGVLKPAEYQKFPLIRREMLSADTARFVFKLPATTSVLGLPIGQHVAIRGGFDDGDGHHTVTRSYTPVSNNKDLGRLELVIKLYTDGQLTGKYLSNLQLGDEVEFRGPKGAMRYRRGMCKNLGMVAGGTGITPMYQLIRAICEDKSDKTQVRLLFGNRSPSDILLRTQLDRYEKMAPEKLSIHYVVDHPTPEWKGGVGYIDKKLMQEHFASPDDDTKILLCGPPGMVNAAKKNLIDLGFQAPGAVSKLSDQIFLF